VIRPALLGEAGVLQALVERAYAAYLPVIGRRPAPMDDDYEARIAAGQAWVLEQEGVPGQEGLVQAVLVMEVAPDHLWLDNIAVDPAAQHGGIGRMLMRFVAEKALERGLPEVRLLTNEMMTRNIDFYTRLGFAEIERREEKGFRRVVYAIASTALIHSAGP
jgi:ribosomal protein S18 acetylase RimI-like enzyme